MSDGGGCEEAAAFALITLLQIANVWTLPPGGLQVRAALRVSIGLAARRSSPNPSPSVNNKEGGFESHPLRHKTSAKCRDRLSANQTVPVLEVQPHCRQTQIKLFRVAAGQGFYVWYGPEG